MKEMPPAEFIYCIRGTRMCQTHRVSRHALERYMNAELANLTEAKNARLTAAVVTGIWGEERASWAVNGDCTCTWTEWSVSGRDKGADWLARCSCDVPRVMVAEHKPKRAVAHWKVTPLTAFSSKAVISRNRMEWVSTVDSDLEPEHPIEHCGNSHPRFYRSTDEKCSLAAPQILADCQIPGSDQVREITVINDSGSRDVNSIWDTNDDYTPRRRREAARFPIYLDPENFPVRTTAELLDSVANVLPWEDSASLKGDQRASLRALFEAMWVRAGIPNVSPAAERWIRQAVRDCNAGSAHTALDEEDPSGHHFKSWDQYVGTAGGDV